MVTVVLAVTRSSPAPRADTAKQRRPKPMICAFPMRDYDGDFFGWYR